MIDIIDYGAGNIASVMKALRFIGEDAVVSGDPEVLNKCSAAVLPGVGSFGDAMKSLRERNLEGPIKKYIAADRPLLGICLGLQILFESSEESPGVSGLSVLKGRILKIPNETGLKIPHMGWNSLDLKMDSGLFEGIGKDPYVYFVHSYYLKAEEDIVTSTVEYGVTIDSSVAKGNLSATQFHPEKSGSVGLEILRNFVKEVHYVC
jgi:glutamine amidotransferase